MGKIKVCGDILVPEPFKEMSRLVRQRIVPFWSGMSLFHSFYLWQF